MSKPTHTVDTTYSVAGDIFYMEEPIVRLLTQQGYTPAQRFLG
jgi:hypothetical protein